jgi:hypothetical protein
MQQISIIIVFAAGQIDHFLDYPLQIFDLFHCYIRAALILIESRTEHFYKFHTFYQADS